MEFCMECCVFTEQVVHCGHLLHPSNQGKCCATSITSWRPKGQEHKLKSSLLCCNTCRTEECSLLTTAHTLTCQ